MSDKIKMMLFRIGDENISKIDSYVEKLSDYLNSEAEFMMDLMIETLISCTSSIPNKSFIYAYVLYTLGWKQNEHAQSIFNAIFEDYWQRISRGEDCIISTKFIAACVDWGYLDAKPYFEFLKQLLNEQAKQPSSDYYLEIVIHGYLFARRRIIEENLEIENDIQSALDSRVYDQNESFVFKSVQYDSSIDQLWDALKSTMHDEQGGDYELFESKIYNLYIRPSKTYRQELLGQNCNPITQLQNVNFGTQKNYKWPRQFSLFAERWIEAYDKASYALARDLCRHILISFKECQFYACQRLTNLQNIPLLANLVFDVIFDELLRLGPSGSAHKTILYSSLSVTLVNEFNRESIFDFGPCVGEALQTIFGESDTSSQNYQSKYNLEEMDLELIDRLIEWLAFFLSQQSFAWDWNSWEFVVDLPDYSIQKVFVRNLLAKWRNIAYVKTLLEMIPDSLQVLIEVEREGVFELAHKDNYDAQVILEAMNTKDDLFSKNQVNIDTSNEYFMDIFVECLLYRSQKSLLHFKKLMTTFDIFIKDLLSSENNQIKMLERITMVYRNNEYRIVNIFDQLLTLSLIDPNAMIKFVFEQIKNNKSTKNLYWKEWTILKNVLTKKNINIQDRVKTEDEHKEDMMDQDLPDTHTQEPDLKLVEQCFADCIQYIASTNDSEEIDQDESLSMLPAAKRIENIQNRLKCFQRQYF